MRLNYFKSSLTVLFMVLFTTVAFAQAVITGTVQDADSFPVAGAAVTVAGTANSTNTDRDGNFSLTTEAGSGLLEISDIANGTQEIAFNVADGETLNLGTVNLAGDGVSLSSLVVVGRGIIDLEEDRQTPVAVSTIYKDEIQAKVAGNVEFPEVMKNVPSVYVSNQTGFGDSQMFLRGFDQSNTAFLLNGQPINGMEDGRMYWSNWAGLADIANAVQVQRGLGSSKLAISSVGGTVNIVSKATERNQGGFARFMVGNDSFFKGTVAYDTGVNENGWGFSIMLDHWQAHRKYAYGTNGAGQNYFLSVGKQAGDHNFNFLVFGAPQWHGNLYSQSEERFKLNRKYNPNYGYDNGEYKTLAGNFYHKPVMNFNWDWELSPESSLSTVIYGSLGRGGSQGSLGSTGSTPRNLPGYTQEGITFNGLVNFDGIRASNEAGESNFIHRSSVNNHLWYGLVSNFSHDFSENLSFNVGGDFRFYRGDHFRHILDLMGVSEFEGVTAEFEPKPWAALFNFADEDERIGYDYSENINYQGGFGQLEYATDAFSVFLQGAVSNQFYRRENRFAERDGVRYTQVSDDANKLGYNIKGGAAYNLNDNHTVYANAGFYSRQPYLDNIFAETAVLADPAVDNEEITGLEAGYRYTNNNLNVNVDVYRTEWANRFVARGIELFDIAQDQTVELNKEYPDVTQLHQGIELSANYRVSRKVKLGVYTQYGDWSYAGNASFRHRDYRNGNLLVNTDASNYTNVDGTPLPAGYQFQGATDVDGVKIGNAAQYSFGANAYYEWVKGFTTGVDFNYFARLYRFVDFSTVAIAEEAGEDFNNTTIPAFGIVDFNLGYKFNFGQHNMILRGNIYNLFNHAYVNQTDSFGVYFGNGRTWNASITYEF